MFLHAQLKDIIKIVTLDASQQEVWEVVTTSEGIASWWMDNTLEPELDNHFVLHAGPFGNPQCKITTYDPINTFQFDWGNEWHLTFQLKPLSEHQTEFVLIHSGWAEEKTQIRRRMNDGWENIVKVQLPKATAEHIK